MTNTAVQLKPVNKDSIKRYFLIIDSNDANFS